LLLSVLGKIFSGILVGRLRDWSLKNEVLLVFQTGFMKGKRSSDNVFIIKTTVDKYLRVKRSRLY
jgi:lipid-binding SYLF domain-containing protein